MAFSKQMGNVPPTWLKHGGDQSGKTKGRLTFRIKSKHLRNEPQSLVMAEANRSSAAAAAATGVVGGLASEPHLLGDECQMSLSNMYQELIDKEEELGGAKNLLSLSKKSSSLKKTTKQPKPQSTPRGKGKI